LKRKLVYFHLNPLQSRRGFEVPKVALRNIRLMGRMTLLLHMLLLMVFLIDGTSKGFRSTSDIGRAWARWLNGVSGGVWRGLDGLIEEDMGRRRQ
jgi:hypothetical protein